MPENTENIGGAETADVRKARIKSERIDRLNKGREKARAKRGKQEDEIARLQAENTRLQAELAAGKVVPKTDPGPVDDGRPSVGALQTPAATKIDESLKGKSKPSWRPARMTDFPKEFERPGMTYGFSQNTQEAIVEHAIDGWMVDTEVARKMEQRYNLSGVIPHTLDGRYVVGDAILMCRPDDEEHRQRIKDAEDRSRVDLQSLEQIAVANAGRPPGPNPFSNMGFYTPEGAKKIPA